MNNQELINQFKPKNINFKVDKFEELILQDMTRFDEDTRVKLHRNLTKLFNNWLDEKLEAKEQVKVNLKGETRTGKSLVGLKILNNITKFYPEKTFNTENQVCANQKEYRQKVSIAEFGDSFLVDENAFANVGLGSMTEVQQLKDVLNITAKKNLHTIFITPRSFLDTGATMGLAYFGKDTNNWLSRFLLYSLKNNMPTLLGFVVFDVGKLFQDSGCFVYKFTGGCTNPKRQTLKDIKNIYNGALIKFSDCIPKDEKGNIKDKDKIDDSLQQCPFYNICNSQMCNYEHKKDTWIEKELTGGLEDRDLERYIIAVKLFQEFSNYDDTSQSFRLSAKNGKELKLKLKMKIPRLTSTKYTGTELDEIMTLVTSMTSIEFLQDVCSQVNLDYEKVLNNIIKRTNISNVSNEKNNINNTKNTKNTKK